MNITGTHIAYKIICERKLWYFSHRIACEQESGAVAEGKSIHENSYDRKNKEIAFGSIKIDWLDIKAKIVHEVKKSNKAEDAHIWQLKYYLYYMKINNIGDYKGMLNYPKLKKTTAVELKASDIQILEEMIGRIEEIAAMELAPEIDRTISFCKKCSYFEFCRI